MKAPPNSLACRVLFLQAADEGRGPLLFGENPNCVCEALLPLVEGVPFPGIYLEFPLAGAPYLDATVLYNKVPAGARFLSETTAGAERVIEWYAGICGNYDDISFGFELDAGNSAPGTAAVHFQPRKHTELVMPFCEALGEPAAGQLYLEQAARMPEGWPLAFFGLFRGRPGFPLRVCGYMNENERKCCAEDPACVEAAFRSIGFTAWNDAMLKQVSAFISASPNGVDFQFDIFPDGTLGQVFAIDTNLGVKRTTETLASFENGTDARLFSLLESWGVADDRWKAAAGMAFTRAIPVEPDGQGRSNFAFVLSPHWVKARWKKGILQAAKLYCLGNAEMVSDAVKAEKEQDSVRGDLPENGENACFTAR